MSSLPSLFGYKRSIDTRLKAFLKNEQAHNSVFPWTKEVYPALSRFVTGGKSVRGSLVLFSASMFSPTLPDGALDIACGIEFIHAGLLIHDDIMDKDTIRRNQPTFHSQFSQMAAVQKGIDTTHFGVSQAINVGDLCFFLGWQLLSQAPVPVQQAVSNEITAVVFAQMQDVSGGHLPVQFTKEVVSALYTHKTARYTFSLPLRIGGQLCSVNEKTLHALESIGEHIGILFQIRDDELNASGDSSITGKSSGTDQQNGKQTLRTVCGDETLKKLQKHHRIATIERIKSLPVSDSSIQSLMELLRFSEERQR